MEFCQDAQFKLEAIPSSTVEYVESLIFLDTIQEKVSQSLFIKKVQCRRPWNFVSLKERPYVFLLQHKIKCSSDVLGNYQFTVHVF